MVVSLALFVVLLFGYVRKLHGFLLGVPLIGRILAPRFKMEALEDQSEKHVGQAILARAQDRLLRMRDEAAGRTELVYELDVAKARERVGRHVDNSGLKAGLRRPAR